MKRLCVIATRFLATAVLGMLVASCATVGGSSTSTAPGIQHPTVGPINPPPPSFAVHEVAQTTALLGTSAGPASASCPSGELALGGGWQLPSPSGSISIQPDRRTVAQPTLEGARVYKAVVQGSTWSVYVSHVALRPVEALQVTAYVECLGGVSGAVVTPVTSQENAFPQVISSANSFCAQGHPVGFGFDLGDAPTKLEFAGESVNAGFGIASVEVANHDSIQHTIVVSVECLSSPHLSWHLASSQGSTLQGGATAALHQGCPSGFFIAGGAIKYHYSILGAGNIYSQHVTSSAWQASVYASSGSTPLAIDGVYASCVKFS